MAAKLLVTSKKIGSKGRAIPLSPSGREECVDRF